MTSAPEPPLRRYRFEDLTLDTGQRRLWRGGEEIHLSKLSFDFLRALVEAAPNLLTHDQLAEAVWGPRRVVTPENLSQRLMTLRHALGEHAEQPRYIEAVRGQGYRLIPRAETDAIEPAPPADSTPLGTGLSKEASAEGAGRSVGPQGPSSASATALRRLRRRVTIAAALALVGMLAAWAYLAVDRDEEDELRAAVDAGSATKVVVLPFTNSSPDPEQRSFSDGLTHELILGLQELAGLTVYGPATSFALRDSNLSVPEIAAELGVQYVTEGSVDRDGNRLRIRAQLSDASGVTVWGDSYNGALEDIFGFQDAIVTGIAGQTRATLGLERALGRVSTESAEAYQLYVVARQGITRGVGLPRLLDLLERAHEIDPEFAGALSLKSSVHALLSARLADGREELVAAEESARQAIAVAPDLGDGYVGLGHVHGMRRNWLAAEESFQRALALGFPLGEMPVYATLLVAEGRFDRGREVYEKVLETDPSQPAALAGLMQVHELRRDREAADAVYRRGRTLYGDDWRGLGNAMVLWIGLGRRDAALIDEAFQLLPGPVVASFANVIDDPARALALVNDMATDPEYASPVGLGNLAMWAAYFGDARMSLRLVEKSVSGEAFLMHVYWMPVFDEVRQLPEFKDLLRNIGLVDLWRTTGWPDFCRPVGSSDFVCT